MDHSLGLGTDSGYGIDPMCLVEDQDISCIRVVWQQGSLLGLMKERSGKDDDDG